MEKFRAEWRGPLHIYCEKTGYEAKLEFKVEGSWDHQIRIKDVAKKTDRVLFDYDDIAKRYRMKLLLPPPEALEETNSLYVWEGCTRAILEGNSRLAAEEKHKVEEEQRRLRRERMQQGIQWNQNIFDAHLMEKAMNFVKKLQKNCFMVQVTCLHHFLHNCSRFSVFFYTVENTRFNRQPCETIPIVFYSWMNLY
ncbi:hypothetical protein GAYE_HTGSCF31FUTG100G0353 [Galdieria yellowstonensis]|uniref:Uncharacterized protein n=1 Tax=Galdieria yellowstonensis TaxID=3028027 RepID=A0AAV9I6D4_9RHOD|nr:hypothetical protein GAYE_HTGSCF31FUTG100G0353 [Galdieria yellowstonensis]